MVEIRRRDLYKKRSESGMNSNKSINNNGNQSIGY